MDSNTPTPPSKSIRLYTVRVHEGVHEDLHGIRAFIAASHPANAERYIQKIVAAMERLRTLPNAWPVARTLRWRGVRHIPIGSHRVIFRVNEKAGVVDVFGVAHAKQHIGPQWLVLRAPVD